MLPAPSGVLKSALLWEGRMHLNRLELHWPKKDGRRRRRKALNFACIRHGTAGLVGNRTNR